MSARKKHVSSSRHTISIERELSEAAQKQCDAKRFRSFSAYIRALVIEDLTAKGLLENGQTKGN